MPISAQVIKGKLVISKEVVEIGDLGIMAPMATEIIMPDSVKKLGTCSMLPWGDDIHYIKLSSNITEISEYLSLYDSWADYTIFEYNGASYTDFDELVSAMVSNGVQETVHNHMPAPMPSEFGRLYACVCCEEFVDIRCAHNFVDHICEHCGWLESGLYRNNGEMIAWEDLKDNNIIHVDNGVLTTITIDDLNANEVPPSVLILDGLLVVDSEVTEIGSLTFLGAPQLKFVIMPSSVKKLNTYSLVSWDEPIYYIIPYRLDEVSESVVFTQGDPNAYFLHVYATSAYSSPEAFITAAEVFGATIVAHEHMIIPPDENSTECSICGVSFQ
jgi:hypothetical protein